MACDGKRRTEVLWSGVYRRRGVADPRGCSDLRGISRTELAHTVCELLEWKRAGGGLKAGSAGICWSGWRARGSWCFREKSRADASQPKRALCRLERGKRTARLPAVWRSLPRWRWSWWKAAEQRKLFRELLSRYHYLGYAMPYGARLQYLGYVSRPRREVVGCVQFSSPAWRMKVRDQWIGWDDATRGATPAARGQQQPVAGPGADPQPGQHAAVLCAEAAAHGLAEAITGWIPGWWRRWWTGSGFTGGVIGRPIGSCWGKPAVGVAWTVPTSVMGRR